MDDGITFTNQLTGEWEPPCEKTHLSVTINKKWSGDQDHKAERPAVKMQLQRKKKNDESWEDYLDPVPVDETKDDWHYTWTHLIKKDKEGNTYTYQVKEIGNTDKYKAEFTDRNLERAQRSVFSRGRNER